MPITLQRDGQRVYLTGDTFAIKDQIKGMGGHWDVDRRSWWVGIAKQAEAERLAASTPSASPDALRPKQDPSDIRLTGKGKYKGRSYFLGSRTRDGAKVRCLTLPDDKGDYLDFWAAIAEVTVEKTYSPREYRGRTEYTTLGSIASFVAREKRTRADGGETCAECGKSGELVQDLEDGMMKHRRCCDIEP